MNLIAFFKKVVKVLNNSKASYALAGGLVASIYRKDERVTNDLDFLIFSGIKSQELATKIIKEFNLSPHVIRKADLEGGPLFSIKKKNTSPYIIAGRLDGKQQAIGLDFILPQMPWFDEAMKRAQYNRINFGFGEIPCITKEDVIISKLYSLSNDQSRFNDLDDLKSIFQADCKLDIPYICGQMQKLGLMVPKVITSFVPKPILLTSKRVFREFRRKTS